MAAAIGLPVAGVLTAFVFSLFLRVQPLSVWITRGTQRRADRRQPHDQSNAGADDVTAAKLSLLPPATGSKVRVRSDLPWLLGLLKRVSPTRSVISMKVGHRMSDQVERTLPNPSAVASTGMSCTTPGDDSMYIIDILYNLLIIQRNISWDGWPTKCLSKYLFSPAIDFPVFATSCPVGQLWRTAFRLSVLGARKNGPGNCVSSLGRRFNRHRRNSTCLWRQDSILSSAVMNSGQPVTRRQRGFHRIWRKLAGAGWQFTSASRVRRALQPPPSGASAA
jgi:hypothetical protein